MKFRGPKAPVDILDGPVFGGWVKWIYKGLNWINSNNELKFDIDNGALNLIWRCIFRSWRSMGRYPETSYVSFKRRAGCKPG